MIWYSKELSFSNGLLELVIHFLCYYIKKSGAFVKNEQIDLLVFIFQSKMCSLSFLVTS